MNKKERKKERQLQTFGGIPGAVPIVFGGS
jgi:hypothetical protein